MRLTPTASRPRRFHWILPILALVLAACGIVAFPAPPDDEPIAAGPAPTASRSATPAPTALPAPELLARALRRRTLGEYDDRASDLRALLDSHPDAAEARA